MSTDYSDTVQRFSGFAADYDAYRPTPPPVIADILCAFAQAARPGLVVDIGCGTGLSTRLWSGRAARVVGIDPSPDMLAQACAATTNPAISYCAGTSGATGLAGGQADIVTCSQSLHWMEPAETFAEAARLLRPGGVFAAYDCDWPASVGSWRVMAAEAELAAAATRVHNERGFAPGLKRWDKSGHLARMRECGRFRYVTEQVFHSVERGNAKRFVRLLLTQGVIQTLLKHGLSEDEIGVTAFRALAEAELGSALRDWYFSYRMRIGVV